MPERGGQPWDATMLVEAVLEPVMLELAAELRIHGCVLEQVDQQIEGPEVFLEYKLRLGGGRQAGLWVQGRAADALAIALFRSAVPSAGFGDQQGERRSVQSGSLESALLPELMDLCAAALPAS